MCEILRKFDIDSLYICPPYLYTVQAIDVKFSQDLTQQKSLKSVNF